MSKRDDNAVVAVDPLHIAAPDGPFPPLYGNENYKSDHRVGPRPDQHHTREEWLLEAQDAHDTLDRGDAVSPVLIEMLFDDAYHVISDFVPPAKSGRKNGDEDEKRREK